MSTSNDSGKSGLAVITIDQAISGGSNVLIAVIAARQLSAAHFGIFGIALIVYTALVAISRGLVSDLLLVHPEESEQRPGEALGAACIVATTLAVLLAVIAAGVRFANASLGDALLVLAACLPLLILEDVGRYLAFATQQPKRALVLDAVWLALMLAAVTALSVAGVHSLPLLVLGWAGSGAVAGLMVVRWKAFSHLTFSFAWLRRTWSLAWRFLMMYLSQQFAALGMSSEVGTIAGANALGAVQGAVLLVRPFTTFQLATTTAGIAQTARYAKDRARVWRQAIRTSAITTLAAVINTAVILVLPARVGRTFLGDTWHVAHPLLLAVGVQMIAIGLISGPSAALAGLKAMTAVAGFSVAAMVIMIAGAGIGASLDGAKGALWLVAAGQGMVMVVAWGILVVRLRDERALPRIEIAGAGIVLTPVTSAALATVRPLHARPGIVLTPVTRSGTPNPRPKVLR